MQASVLQEMGLRLRIVAKSLVDGRTGYVLRVNPKLIGMNNMCSKLNRKL